MRRFDDVLFWLFSPTYKYSELRKRRLLRRAEHHDLSKSQVTRAIKRANVLYLLVTLVFAVLVGLLFRHDWYYDPQLSYANYLICFIVGWLLFFSRALEIFRAFFADAVEKLNGKPARSWLNYGERLSLAFNSYVEVMVGFGVLYYMLPQGLFKNSCEPYHFVNIFEAIYFSAMTMFTVGYGDIGPSHWLTQALVLLQCVCGMTLALVCFTVYTTLALREEI
jgi:voltage-gated potassium channel